MMTPLGFLSWNNTTYKEKRKKLNITKKWKRKQKAEKKARNDDL